MNKMKIGIMTPIAFILTMMIAFILTMMIPGLAHATPSYTYSSKFFKNE